MCRKVWRALIIIRLVTDIIASAQFSSISLRTLLRRSCGQPKRISRPSHVEYVRAEIDWLQWLRCHAVARRIPRLDAEAHCDGEKEAGREKESNEREEECIHTRIVFSFFLSFLCLLLDDALSLCELRNGRRKEKKKKDMESTFTPSMRA